MWPPCTHIVVVIYYTYNLRTTITAVGGVILLLIIYIYRLIYMYYDVAYANIKIINLLDKLLNVFCINKINSTFVQNIFNIILSQS